MAFERGAPKLSEGQDFRAFANEVARRMEADAVNIEAREREAAAKYEYEAAKTYFVRVAHLIGQGVEVEMIDSSPLVGRVRSTARNYDCAISNLYFAVAQLLQRRGFISDWDEARTYALEKFSFVPSFADEVRA